MYLCSGFSAQDAHTPSLGSPLEATLVDLDFLGDQDLPVSASALCPIKRCLCVKCLGFRFRDLMGQWSVGWGRWDCLSSLVTTFLSRGPTLQGLASLTTGQG